MTTHFRLVFITLLGLLFITSCNQAGQEVPADVALTQNVTLTAHEQLGKSIFFDENLSLNQNQSCASCHAPNAGWAGPTSTVNAHSAVYEGSISSTFGNRKPPTAAYATLSPIFHLETKANNHLYIGGNFWDGRATGERLGNPAADQAQGPFINPAEQALPDAACVVYRVCEASYAISLEDVYGEGSCDITWPDDIEQMCTTAGSTLTLSTDGRNQSDMLFDRIALSIAAYEASAEVNAFSSKFDQRTLPVVKLSKLEKRGLALFKGQAQCSNCHSVQGKNPLLTDFTYDNLGLPANPELSSAGADFGLGGFLQRAGFAQEVYEAELGKFKVPTLRNVDLRPDSDFVKAYGHNGYFKTLEGIVHFYNTRDVKLTCPGAYTEAQALAANCWPEPEFDQNVNQDELGDLGLNAEDEAALVAFLKTLSDGYQP